MNINEAMKIVFSKDMIIYPIISGRMFNIAYKIEGGDEKFFPKKLSQGDDTSEALVKTYLYFGEKIKKDSI
jgi:hypothetical protein